MKTTNTNRSQPSSTSADSWQSKPILPARAYDDPTLYSALTSGLGELRKKHVQESHDLSMAAKIAFRASIRKFVDSLESLEMSLGKLNEKEKKAVSLQADITFFNEVLSSKVKITSSKEVIRTFLSDENLNSIALKQKGDLEAGKEVFGRFMTIAEQSKKDALRLPHASFSRLFRTRLAAAVNTNRNSYRNLIDPELRQIQEFKDSAKAFAFSSESAFQKNVQALTEGASECIREFSTTESPAHWYQAITALSQLCQDARHFSNQLCEGDEHSIQDIEAEIVGRVTLQLREGAAQALINEMEARLTSAGAQAGRISDLKTLLIAMDFYLSQENFRSFENLAQRFIGGTSAQRTRSLGEVENILAQHLPDCEEHDVTERAARLRSLLTRATSIGVGKALQEERAASAKQTAERDKEEGAEVPADLAVIARFVENEDLQRQLHGALSKNELEVGLIVADVEEQLDNIVGKEIALELLRENPLLVVDALLEQEQFREYLAILSRVVPVISATRTENSYSPRFFCSTKAIQALIESEGAELGREPEHPESHIIRELQAARVSSPQLAYAILKFGFASSGEYPHGAFIPEAARFKGVYDGIVGPIPSKERIRAQEAELAQLGIITFGSKRSAALSENTKLPKELHTALWKMQNNKITTQALAIRIDR